MPTHVIHFTPGPAWKQGRTVYEQDLEAHGHYHQRLLEDGTLLLAGPYLDDSGGLAVVSAGADEVQQLIDDDPAVQSGVFVATACALHKVFDRATGQGLG